MKALPLAISWNPELSIYASRGFLSAVGDDCGWLGGTDDTGKVRCILPYTIIHKARVRMVRFRMETIPLGDELELEEERTFLNSAMTYFRSRKADIVIPATTNTIFRTYPDGATAAPYGTYIIDLDKDDETIFGNFSSSHRRKIRLASKAGVRITDGLEYTEQAYALVHDTFKRSSMSFMPLSGFKRMLDGLGEYVKILIAEYQGTLQGCVVIPFSRYSAYYNYGGSIAEPVAGAMTLLHWEAIRMFHSLKVKHYDFCGVRINPEKGSKQEGLSAFKERFGPRLVQGYLWKYTLNPIKSALYSIAVRVLRGGDIVDAEHNKLRIQ